MKSCRRISCTVGVVSVVGSLTELTGKKDGVSCFIAVVEKRMAICVDDVMCMVCAGEY